MLERPFDRPDDSAWRKAGSWLRASARRSTAGATMLVDWPPWIMPMFAGALAAVLADAPVPAVAVQLGDGQQGDGDGADALLGMHAGVARPAGDVDVHSIAAGGRHGELGGRSAVEIEGQLRVAQQGQPGGAGPAQPDLLLNRPEERKRRVGQPAAEDFQAPRRE